MRTGRASVKVRSFRASEKELYVMPIDRTAVPNLKLDMFQVRLLARARRGRPTCCRVCVEVSTVHERSC